MIVEAAHFALALGLALAVAQMGLSALGAARGDVSLMNTGRRAAAAQAAVLALSFLGLIVAFIQSDFSVGVVAQHSHTEKPFLYKIAAAWGHHEGSMLLWVLIVAAYGAAVAYGVKELRASTRAWTLSMQAVVNILFLSFLLFTSNPFARVEFPPLDGAELNPVLQDPALAIHPPMLYLGYVGYSLVFAFAAAALIEGKVDEAWAKAVRPWALASWATLTLGIALGSYWAYYELGWGGWWFWDPVENASFMPWLIGTALLHSVIVTERRGAMKSWTLLLALLAFSFSLLGAFLVRSGVLTSVHAFALDPDRGVYLLGIMGLLIGGAFALYAWRAPSLKAGGVFHPISREGGLVLNNLVLTACCATVLIGTLYPLALEMATGEKISVGPPYFNFTFGLIILPALLVVPFGPLLAWKRGDVLAASQRLWAALAVGLVVAIISALLRGEGAVLPMLAAGIGFWILFGSFVDVWDRAGGWNKAGLTRLQGTPLRFWGRVAGHAGLGVMVLGIVGATAWRAERVELMKPGDTVEIAGYEVRFDSVREVRGPNYIAEEAQLTASKGARAVDVLTPQRRFYPASNTPTSEVSLHTVGADQLYVSLGDARDGGGHVVRIHYYPLILLIYLGSLLMAAGAVFALWRVAPERRAAFAKPVPAE